MLGSGGDEACARVRLKHRSNRNRHAVSPYGRISIRHKANGVHQGILYVVNRGRLSELAAKRLGFLAREPIGILEKGKLPFWNFACHFADRKIARPGRGAVDDLVCGDPRRAIWPARLYASRDNVAGRVRRSSLVAGRLLKGIPEPVQRHTDVNHTLAGASRNETWLRQFAAPEIGCEPTICGHLPDIGRTAIAKGEEAIGCSADHALVGDWVMLLARALERNKAVA